MIFIPRIYDLYLRNETNGINCNMNSVFEKNF